MNRILVLTSFLIRDLSRSLAAIVPLSSTLVFGIIAFEYGMDQAQFITVAGIGMGAICLASGLMLASRSNRASSYLFVTRLRRRTELLVALLLGNLAVSAALALLMIVANLITGRLTLDFPSALWILPTWLPLWLLAAALALLLSGLVARGGSHLIGYVLMAGLLIANDRKAFLIRHGMDWAAQGVGAILWPVGKLLAQASAGIHGGAYALAWALTCAYAASIFALAAALFRSKDLLWSE